MTVHTCEQCRAVAADGYAMGPKAGDWGGWYCAPCADKLGWPMVPSTLAPAVVARLIESNVRPVTPSDAAVGEDD